jgi:hypothetical protein
MIFTDLGIGRIQVDREELDHILRQAHGKEEVHGRDKCLKKWW